VDGYVVGLRAEEFCGQEAEAVAGACD
jgi:hypothetical protein